MSDKLGSISPGTLVLLSAMILVSSIVFFLLTDMFGEITQQAKSIADVTQKDAGVAITVLQLYGEDGSSGSVDYFYEEVKPPLASDEIRLGETLLVMQLGNTSREYTYNGSIDCAVKNSSDGTSIYNSTRSEEFGVTYMAGSVTYNDTVFGGETVRLCWKSPQSVSADNRVVVNFFSVVGFAATVDTTYTGLMSDKTVYFYP